MWGLWRNLAVGSLVKAIYMTAVLAVVDVTFLKSLVLVIASAAASGGFGIYIARLQVRSQRGVHDRLDELEQRQKDMAAAIGIDKRRTDELLPPVPQPQEPAA